MPTVNDLRTQIANETGLDATADSTVIIAALNRAARRIVSETDCCKGTPATIAGDASTVDISLSTLTGLRSIDSVYLLSGGAYVPVTQSPVHSVIDARTQSAITQYAWEGGTTLLVDGPVGVGNSLYIRFSASPTAMAAGGAESTVTATGIPIDFHEDLLARFAMVYLLEGYEGEEDRAAYHRSLAQTELQRFTRFLSERGGDELPNARYGAQHFATPDPLEIR